VQRLPDGCRPAAPFLSRDLRYPRYGRVLADFLVEGTHTVDDITARLAGLEAAPSEVPMFLDMRFQGGTAGYRGCTAPERNIAKPSVSSATNAHKSSLTPWTPMDKVL
jgi:hypothetical protein